MFSRSLVIYGPRFLSRRCYAELAHDRGFTDAELADPNINPKFHESNINYLPDKPRLFCTTPELKALKNKEKGDWSKLTEEEMHTLYRSCYRYSIAEINQGTDAWKSIAGVSFLLVGIALWYHWFLHAYVFPPIPKRFTDPELIQKEVKMHLQQHQGLFDGVSSLWDYENNRWK